MAKKIEPRPIDIYCQKVARAQRHGWKMTGGIRKVDGKGYTELLRIHHGGTYEHHRYYRVGISITTGKIVALPNT